jgi:hypothetical protein
MAMARRLLTGASGLQVAGFETPAVSRIDHMIDAVDYRGFVLRLLIV